MYNDYIIVITDLDGSLLDHDNYDFSDALPALNLIKKHDIPLILNSSKTAAEIKQIKKTLNIRYPFVVENGAGIYIPVENGDDKLIKFGKDRKEIITLITEIREKLQLSFIGFNDMSVAKLQQLTGLNEAQATNAMQRDFTEPVLWQDDDDKWPLFCKELELVGLSYAKGGRFISISIDVDKGKSIHWLKNYYKKELNLTPIIIALGDSENDKQMLEEADYPVLIKSPAHEFPKVDINNLIYTTEYGPLGWNNSVIKLINKITLR